MSKTSFKANSKALAETEADGIAKLLYRKDTGEVSASASGRAGLPAAAASSLPSAAPCRLASPVCLV